MDYKTLLLVDVIQQVLNLAERLSGTERRHGGIAFDHMEAAGRLQRLAEGAAALTHNGGTASANELTARLEITERRLAALEVAQVVQASGLGSPKRKQARPRSHTGALRAAIGSVLAQHPGADSGVVLAALKREGFAPLPAARTCRHHLQALRKVSRPAARSNGQIGLRQ